MAKLSRAEIFDPSEILAVDGPHQSTLLLERLDTRTSLESQQVSSKRAA